MVIAREMIVYKCFVIISKVFMFSHEMGGGVCIFFSYCVLTVIFKIYTLLYTEHDFYYVFMIDLATKSAGYFLLEIKIAYSA